jgi:hypothetical protein
MDADLIRQKLQENPALANDPSFISQALSFFGLGGGGAGTPEVNPQASRLTGNIGVNPMTTGPITTGGSSSGAVGNMAGASTYNPSRSFERQLGVPITGGGGGGGGVPITGGGGAGGGGGRPPITGAGADAPMPSGGGGGGASSIPAMGAAGSPPAGGGGKSTPTVTTADGGKGFQKLLNTKGLTGFVDSNRGGLGKAARYAGVGTVLDEIGQGDFVGAAGAGAATLAAGPILQRIAAGIPTAGLPGMAAKGALYGIGSLLAAGGGANLATGIAKMAGGVIPGAQGIVDTVTGQRREEGKSGLTGKGVGYSDEDIRRYEQLANISKNLPVDVARQMLPIQNQYENAQLGRSMQQAQQNAQLRGALDRQLQLAQLTQGSQVEAGATVRSILNSSNPYAAATFRG